MNDGASHWKGSCADRLMDHVPLGIAVVNAAGQVMYWNRWLKDRSGLGDSHTLGKTLQEIYPDLHKPRYDMALSNVIQHSMPQVLSQALNRFLIPIPVQHKGRHGLSLMQQHTHIEPLKDDDGNTYAVITIIDVTDEVIRSSVLAELAQKLEYDSNRDPLTNLYNRRFMWEWLLQELRSCARFKNSLACVLFDLDHFKRINDTWGHDMGDQVLLKVAEVIAEELRDSDILVRYGGEEFIAFLPHCDMTQAMQTAERILQSMRQTEFTQLYPKNVTLSAGVSCYTADNPLTGEDLLKQADRRLYEAKNRGRDRVVGS